MKLKRLKELRLERSLTQKDLAELLSVSKHTYWKYEKGKSKISMTNIAILSNFYNVPIDYILELTNQRKRH